MIEGDFTNNYLSLDSPQAVKIFELIIEELIDKKIKEFQRPFLVGTVTSVGSGVVDVLLDDGSTTELTNIPNKTGETLNTSDQVYILKINGSTNNMVALIKK